MSFLNRDMANKKILLFFLILALFLLLPFFIVDLVLAYEKSDDYCLSYAGMKDSGIHGITLRDWLKIDGFSRLVFLIVAVFFFLASKYLRDHYALVTVESSIFRIYYLFLFGWIIFGAVLFWGNVQRSVIFESIPTQRTIGHDIFGQNLINSPRSQLNIVGSKNSANYYDYHRFDRGPWFHQELIPNWNSTDPLDQDRDHYQIYQDIYAPNDQPVQGFRYGCKRRVSVYMWILLLFSLIALPIALLLLGMRSSRTQPVHTYSDHHHVNNVNARNSDVRYVANPPVYTNSPVSDARLR